jgi:hypothetical protein
MSRLFLSLNIIVFLGLCAIAVTFMAAPPSTRDLDEAIAEVRSHILLAEKDLSGTGGSLVGALVNTRLEILKVTESALLLKRESILRRIDLRYTISGHEVSPPSKSELEAIQSEITSVSTRIALSKSEADSYSGGLVQALALAKMKSEELTLAQLQQSLLARQYGLLIQLSQTNAESNQPAVGANTVTKDTDAL